LAKPELGNKQTFIGIGVVQDPCPELAREAKIKIASDQCKYCGCFGRKLLPSGAFFALFCDKCKNSEKLTVPVTMVEDVAYIYWCADSKFATDKVELSFKDKKAIEAILKDFEQPEEPSRWAVAILGGRCFHSKYCINSSCYYNIKD